MVNNSTESVTLQQIWSKLHQLEQLLVRPKLGFQKERSLRYVYCNLTKGNGSGWYELVGEGDDRKAITLPPTYWGYVENIDFYPTTRRQKPVYKFRFWVNGWDENGDPELTIFESGKDAFFAKTVMAGMARCSPEALKAKPIRMHSYPKEIQKGENQGDRTLAVMLGFGEREEDRIDCRWNNSNDWRQLAQQAIWNVRAASGYVPSEERQQDQAA